MASFGVDEWIERGEAFSGYFGMFSRLSVFEAREVPRPRRRFLTGASWAAVPGSAALVLASIGVTSFDGAQEGALKSAISSTNHIHDIGFGTIATFRITNSLWLAIVLAGVGLLYWLGIRGMHTVSGSPRARELARSFAHTLIPIALAYIVAHYFSAFIYQEQAQFTYILSDPLGNGSDLFGTAGGDRLWVDQLERDLVRAGRRPSSATSPRSPSLTTAPWPSTETCGRRPARSTFMLAVMVAFTCFGLYLLLPSPTPRSSIGQLLDRDPEALRLDPSALENDHHVRRPVADEVGGGLARIHLLVRRTQPLPGGQLDPCSFTSATNSQALRVLSRACSPRVSHRSNCHCA